MSTAIEIIYDVFLSHSARDRGMAELVRQSADRAGLEVFSVDSLEGGDKALAAVRSTLAECSAVILLLTRSTLESKNTAFEIGMALAWNKPIYVLYDGIDVSELPDYLREFPVRPVSELDAVVQEIADAQQPLADEAREELVDSYCQIDVPTDQLLTRPVQLRKLAEDFTRRSGTMIGGERLLQELIRLRKQGRLPRLQK